jgi:fumarate reductase subunit D
MRALIVPVYLILWVVVFGVGFVVGDRTGMRYEALCLTGILGFVIFLLILAVNGTDPVPARGQEARS